MKNYELKIKDGAPDAENRHVEVSGCLDSHTVVDFEKTLHQVMNQGATRINVELSGLNYISSAGISALMGLTHQLRKKGGDLVLMNPTEKVLRVFRTLGFTNIFSIVEGKTPV